MGTNPIAMGFPYKEDSPILLDFATSMAAEGKMRVYQARGKMLPGEWLLDANGKPSRDPNDLYNGGAILPMGGIDGGHKGYALAFMVDLMGGTLAELTDGTVRDDSTTRGASIMVIDLSALGDLGKVKEDVHDLVTYLKDTPPNIPAPQHHHNNYMDIGDPNSEKCKAQDTLDMDKNNNYYNSLNNHNDILHKDDYLKHLYNIHQEYYI